MKGGGTDAPEEDAEEEETRPSVSYDDMWAKTLLDGSDSSVIMTLLSFVGAVLVSFFHAEYHSYMSIIVVNSLWISDVVNDSHFLLMRAFLYTTG